MVDYSVETDADIILSSRTAPERFGAIFDRHAEPVLRFLVRRIGGDDAGTVLGEVFRIAFERRDAYEADRTSALPWLYGIAAHQLLNHRRSQARRLRACADLALRSQQCVGDGGLEAIVVLPKLIEAIESLPEAERSSLLLSAVDELSYEDIALALEVPIGTVRSRINRARRRLRDALEGEA